MRTFYSEYVQHCMRFYARYPHPEFRKDIDKLNWEACDHVVKSFTDKEQELLMSVYRESDIIADNVYKVSLERKLNQDVIWKLVKELEHKVAKRRKLI